jgi:hypothetical protein
MSSYIMLKNYQNLTELYFKIDDVTSWYGDITKENARRYAAKSVIKYLKSLKMHKIKWKFICFAWKIEIYFIREHQLSYCIWCSLSENIFQSYRQNTQISSIYLIKMIHLLFLLIFVRNTYGKCAHCAIDWLYIQNF